MDLVTSCKMILARVCVYNPVVLEKINGFVRSKKQIYEALKYQNPSQITIIFDSLPRTFKGG